MADNRQVTDLVTRAKNGEKQAWDALVERYAPLIWSICRRYRLPPGCQQLLALLMADPPVPCAEISTQLGILAGSIEPDRRRCLDRLGRDPVIAALVNTEAASA